MKKHVYITVRIDMIGDADISKVIDDVDYSFNHDDITGTEIIGIERVNYSGKVIKS